jgi:hypothetical protein
LSAVEELTVQENKLVELPVNVLSTLKALKRVRLIQNNLTSIDEQLFASNLDLIEINLADNQINAIGRNFLNGLSKLRKLNLVNNQCVNYSFSNIGLATSDEQVRNILEQCFRNAEYVETTTTTPQPEPEQDHFRRFILEVFGPLNLKFENGTQVVEV